jgi:hypothetical protein
MGLLHLAHGQQSLGIVDPKVQALPTKLVVRRSAPANEPWKARLYSTLQRKPHLLGISIFIMPTNKLTNCFQLQSSTNYCFYTFRAFWELGKITKNNLLKSKPNNLVESYHNPYWQPITIKSQG